MGRLFDAAGAILGVRAISHYEGQAAMELEALASPGTPRVLDFPIVDSEELFVLDPLPLLQALGRQRAGGASVADLARDFHATVAATTVRAAKRAAEAAGVETVVLGGGTFQNALLLDWVVTGLDQAGVRVLVPRRLSPNDGAISFGQAVIASAQLASGALPQGGR
jgi:hydrogenase maturation protein HypF